MEEQQSAKTLKDLLRNPSDLMEIIKDPGKSGMEYYNSLSNKNKQYLAFAAGVGLIIYGFTLTTKKD